MDEQIRQILKAHGRIAVGVETLSDHDDLFEAGMTSHANVNVMLALEDAFDIEFPEAMLQRSTFASVAAIREAVTELTSVPSAQ
jgi:acyl carrier protein